MIIVIQCAASKRPDAGCLKSASGNRIIFVADPESAPAEDGNIYARPDDLSYTGESWREVLLEYNRTANENPLRLFPAYQLYQNRAYQLLVERFGPRKVYILSAGWGLIKADFLTPYYDITYSQSAEEYKRHRKSDSYQDFCQLTENGAEDVVFFGGKDYLPLFRALTLGLSGDKRVFYNSARRPRMAGLTFEKFETSTRTNWHYECVNAFISSGGF